VAGWQISQPCLVPPAHGFACAETTLLCPRPAFAGLLKLECRLEKRETRNGK